MRSIEASAGTSGRQMRLLTGQSSEFRVYSSFIQTANRLTQVCSPNAMPVSPQDWLHDWLTRACMSCLAFSGPIRPQAPRAPWQHGLQHSLVQHLPRGGLYRGGSVRTARARAALHTACRQFASHTAGCSAERVNKYTLGQCCSSFDIADFRKGRRPQPDSSENREEEADHCEL